MIRASTALLIIATLFYLLIMMMIVTIEDFFLRMYGQIAVGSLYIFLSAIALTARYMGWDEIARYQVEQERKEREMQKRLNKRKLEEQKKIKNEEGSP